HAGLFAMTRSPPAFNPQRIPSTRPSFRRQYFALYRRLFAPCLHFQALCRPLPCRRLPSFCPSHVRHCPECDPCSLRPHLCFVVGILAKRPSPSSRSHPCSYGSSRHACRNLALAARGYNEQLQLCSYCLEPVVLLFGFGEQFRFYAFASFSQAAMLAYLQFSPPPADILMQKGEFPIVCDFCM